MSVLDTYNGKAFCGIYSKDGDYFITTSQGNIQRCNQTDCYCNVFLDRQIRLYKSNDNGYKLINSIHARDVGWSIIDVAFSPDQQHFVYSTWSSSCKLLFCYNLISNLPFLVHMCAVNGDTDKQEPLCLVNTGRRFCIFSVIFSSDGRLILGGANDGCIYVYDRQRIELPFRVSYIVISYRPRKMNLNFIRSTNSEMQKTLILNTCNIWYRLYRIVINVLDKSQ